MILSNRPGLRRAESRSSGLFVVPTMISPGLLSRPSISERIIPRSRGVTSSPAYRSRDFAIASMSSKKMIAGRRSFAVRKSCSIFCSLSPYHFDITSEHFTVNISTFSSPARADIRRVFPQPGGPKSRIPRGGAIPYAAATSGFLSGTRIDSRRSAFTSARPPPSEYFVERASGRPASRRPTVVAVWPRKYSRNASFPRKPPAVVPAISPKAPSTTGAASSGIGTPRARLERTYPAARAPPAARAIRTQFSMVSLRRASSATRNVAPHHSATSRSGTRDAPKFDAIRPDITSGFARPIEESAPPRSPGVQSGRGAVPNTMKLVPCGGPTNRPATVTFPHVTRKERNVADAAIAATARNRLYTTAAKSGGRNGAPSRERNTEPNTRDPNRESNRETSETTRGKTRKKRPNSAIWAAAAADTRTPMEISENSGKRRARAPITNAKNRIAHHG